MCRVCVVLTVVLVVQCVCGMVWGLVIALSCRAREQVRWPDGWVQEGRITTSD